MPYNKRILAKIKKAIEFRGNPLLVRGYLLSCSQRIHIDYSQARVLQFSFSNKISVLYINLFIKNLHLKYLKKNHLIFRILDLESCLM